MSRAIGSHHSAVMKTDVWLTPPDIIGSLGVFDLDPCSPLNRPWDTANGQDQLKTIYDLVEQIAPDKCERNSFYREKVRQVLQESFNRVSKGVYTSNQK